MCSIERHEYSGGIFTCFAFVFLRHEDILPADCICITWWTCDGPLGCAGTFGWRPTGWYNYLHRDLFLLAHLCYLAWGGGRRLDSFRPHMVIFNLIFPPILWPTILLTFNRWRCVARVNVYFSARKIRRHDSWLGIVYTQGKGATPKRKN